MQQILERLYMEEGREISQLMGKSANELGNGLIELYYSRGNLMSRELIREFMRLAGVVWLRKLLTKDTGIVVSSESKFASLADYTQLLAANDGTLPSISHG